jgi:hypothetical protein
MRFNFLIFFKEKRGNASYPKILGPCVLFVKCYSLWFQVLWRFGTSNLKIMKSSSEAPTRVAETVLEFD